MKKILLPLMIGLMFAGCATKPTYTNIGHIDFKARQYDARESLSELSLAIAKPEVKVNIDFSRTLKAALRERIEDNALRLACFLTEEMKKSLLAQGFTVTETFDSLNNMTFTQKRNTSALFTAFIKIELEEDSMTTIQNSAPTKIDGDLNAKAKLQIATIEPLSGEIIWLKSVPIEDVQLGIHYPYYTRMTATDAIIPNELLSAAASLDALFLGTGDKVIDAMNKYVDVKEFQFLNMDIKKLKKIKRY